MDVVTHAMMGTVIAGPMILSRPVAAACFILGSVLPDVDALSRVFGKRAFLRWHQTYTHGLPSIIIVAAAVPLLLPTWAADPLAALALAAGMAMHVLLDATNTYGTAVLAPISLRRFCTDWIFFIDAPVIAVTVVAVGGVLFPLWTQNRVPPWIAVSYVVFLVGYWGCRAALHWRARRHAPQGTRSLIPSALVPWRYFGYGRHGAEVELFQVNALTGRIAHDSRRHIWDEQYEVVLSSLPEFRLMRRISSGYHVVAVTGGTEGQQLVCRDLRTRNFGGSFGELAVTLGPTGTIKKAVFHA